MLAPLPRRTRHGLARLAVGGLVVALTAGCAGGDSDDGGRGGRNGVERVPASHGTAVPQAAVTPPTYAALSFGFRTPGGSRVVSGERTTALPATVAGARWLSSGNVLLEDGRKIWVLDPRTGRRVGPEVPAAQERSQVSAGRITVTAYRGFQVREYDDDLRLLRTVRVPTSGMDTNQATGSGASLRITRAVSVGGALWVTWYVNSEDDTREDHGVLRIPLPKGGGQGKAVEVARNRPLDALYPSSDGRALLALVRRTGQNVSCRGCGADNVIEEWDVRSGQATSLGRPPGFDDWRLLAVDKVGRRVVARFAVRKGEGGPSIQTWVRNDGRWTERKALRDVVVQWQGQRPLRQVVDVAQDRGDGAPYVLRSGRKVLLTPQTACDPRRPRLCLEVTAPGPPLRPPGRQG